MRTIGGMAVLALFLVTGVASGQERLPPPSTSGAAPAPPPGPPPPGYGAPPPGYGYPQQPGYPPVYTSPGAELPPGTYYYYPPQQVPQAYYYYGAPMTPPPRTERRSTGMMVGGIVMTGIGAIVFIAGGALVAGADSSYNSYDCLYPTTTSSTYASCEDDRDKRTAIGAGMMIGGGVLVAAGIPLLVIGAKKVRVDQPKQAARPELMVTGTGAKLRWQF